MSHVSSLTSFHVKKDFMEDRSKGEVWVFAEQEEGKLSDVPFELLGKGRELADKLGVKLGAGKLPESWLKPLNDTLYSGVDGYPKSSIKALAEKTMTFMK